MSQGDPTQSPSYAGLSPTELSEGEVRINSYSLEELDAELPDLCDRVQRHIESLSQWFVDRREVIEIATLCAVLGEPLLLIGPPLHCMMWPMEDP